MDDLCGFVQGKKNWEVLNLPAIAKKDEEYELLSGEKVGRRAGEVLNKNLDTLESLEKLKTRLEKNFLKRSIQPPIHRR